MIKLRHLFVIAFTAAHCGEKPKKATTRSDRPNAIQVPLTGGKVTMRLEVRDTANMDGVRVRHDRTGEIVPVNADGNFTLSHVDSGDWVTILPGGSAKDGRKTEEGTFLLNENGARIPKDSNEIPLDK
jgi:hypothetical protein